MAPCALAMFLLFLSWVELLRRLPSSADPLADLAHEFWSKKKMWQMLLRGLGEGWRERWERWFFQISLEKTGSNKMVNENCFFCVFHNLYNTCTHIYDVCWESHMLICSTVLLWCFWRIDSILLAKLLGCWGLAPCCLALAFLHRQKKLNL